MLTPEAREQVEAFEHDRRSGAAAYRVGTSRFGARTLGSVALATIGTTVWTDPDRARNAHDEPMGGIVLDVIDAGRRDDPDTGEITLARAFRCYDFYAPWHLAFRTFADSLIDPSGVEATPPGRLALTVRRFCLKVAQGKAGLLTSSEGQLLADAHHLTAVLLGGAL